MNCDRWRWILATVLLSNLVTAEARSQVVADDTLGTQVSLNGQTFTIRGGARLEKNLFHSFRQFSLPNGSVAEFQPDAGVTNILVRVTGSSRSNIQGAIRSLSKTNLFLMNPNGILFGRDAQLEIGGSFVGTTAKAILFPNGGEFSLTSAVTPQTELLKVNPSALLVNQLSGAIRMEAEDFAVSPGENLLLIGGDVQLQRSFLSALAGRLEIAAIADGTIGLSTDTAQRPQLVLPQRWTGADLRIAGSSLNVSGTTEGNGNPNAGVLRLFAGSITATDSSGFPNQLDARGNATGRTGAIHLLALGQIRLQNAQLLVPTIASGLGGGSITITAGEQLRIAGTETFFNGETDGRGRGSDIWLQGRSIGLDAGASIQTSTNGVGDAGTVSLVAIEQVQIRSSANEPKGITSIASPTSTGRGGDIQIRAGSLRLDGSLLSAFTVGPGRAGDIVIDVGTGQVALTSSQIAANTEQRGQGGDIHIRAGRISLTNSVVIASTTAASIGNGGDIVLRAIEAIDVQDGATIAVGSAGAGQGGNIQIQAGTVALRDRGSISAETQSSQGGNISLQLRDLLLLRQNSLISTTAGLAEEAGDGGNIAIRTPFIVSTLTENNDIRADAFEGRGGNIRIRANGVFGIQVQPQKTPNSDITASSERGVDGVISIDTLDADPSRGLVPLAPTLVDPTNQVAQSCATASRNPSSFTVTGRGGVPPSPIDPLRPEAGLAQWISLEPGLAQSLIAHHSVASTQPIVEAQTWQRDAKGDLYLIARSSVAQWSAIAPPCP